MKNLKVSLPQTGEETTVPVSVSSKQYSLNWRDSLIGLMMAVGTGVGPYLYEALMNFLDYKPVDFDWRTALKFAISAGVMYVTRKFFQQGKIVINKKELV